MSPLPSTESQRFRWRACAVVAAFCAGIAALSAGPVCAQAGNSIDSLSVSKASSGRTVIKFTLKAPLANPPAGFAISNPPRIALDFPDTGNGLGRTAQEIGEGFAIALRAMGLETNFLPWGIPPDTTIPNREDN